MYDSWTVRTFVKLIRETSDLNVLRSVHNSLSVMFRQHSDQDIVALQKMMSVVHDAMFRRVVEMSQQKLSGEGWGGPPSLFSWLVLGSAGRREQTLHTDQDHAIIFEHESDREYFQQLATQVVISLERVGYPLCAGNVMPTNGRWLQSRGSWTEQIHSYLDYPDWSSIRYLMMMIDARPVLGGHLLLQDMRREMFQGIRGSRFVQRQAATFELKDEVGLDWWGRFRLQRWGEHEGLFHLKDSAYLPFVNAVRVGVAVQGVETTSTSDRLAVLAKMGGWNPEFIQQTLHALETLLRYRMKSNVLDIHALSDESLTELKQTLRTIAAVKKKIRRQLLRN